MQELVVLLECVSEELNLFVADGDGTQVQELHLALVDIEGECYGQTAILTEPVPLRPLDGAQVEIDDRFVVSQ